MHYTVGEKASAEGRFYDFLLSFLFICSRKFKKPAQGRRFLRYFLEFLGKEGFYYDECK
jgi:hypothetical protein